MYVLGLNLFGEDKHSADDKVPRSRIKIATEINMAKAIKISHSGGNQVLSSGGKYLFIVEDIKIL